MRIKKENAAAIVIDIQEKLFPFIHEHELLERNTAKLIEGLKALGIEIIVTEQYSKGLGPTIPGIEKVLVDAYKPIEKMTFSCCGTEEFIRAMESAGKKNIIVCGIESHVCVLQTVVDLIERGFKPVVVEDCVSSRNVNDKKIAIERMRAEGAIITTYESILFELCEVSGTEQFKAISKIVK